MPSDYAQISRENLEEYGHNRTGWREDLLVDLYPDRTHFVFELLQNAEDALCRPNGSRGSGRVSFVLAPDAVRFSHYGDPFTTDDVRGVCAIARRAKERDLTAIGRFGIGFKSVYAITDRPEVHSGDEHFTVRDYVQPAAVRPIALAEGETVIVLPLKERARVDDIAGQLERLGDERTLLFLRGINEIVWSAEGGRSGSHRREEEVEADGVRRVRLLSQTEGEDREEEAWLVFSREVHHERKSAGYVELAFRITKDDDGQEAIDVIRDSRLAAFFPTEVPTRLGMLVQGPYRTTPARDNIPRDDDWNRHLVEETAGRLVDGLRHLRDRGLLGVHVFDALPLSRQRFAGGFFEPMFDAVHEAIRSEPLLPAHRGGPVSASQACLTDESGLRNLISRQRLAELLDEDEPVAWLAAEITREKTPKLDPYLTNEHGVRELDTEGLLQRLDKPFIEAQPDQWIQRLYEFLGRGDTDSYDYLLLLDGMPLIRLEDGTHIEWLWGEPVAFLPTEPPSGYPNTVRPAVCKSKFARAFLRSLGLSEPDQVDDLVRNVLPKYSEGNDVNQREYAADLRQSLDVFGSREQRGRLTDVLREAPFVRAVDAGTGALSFVRPADVYVGLDDLFNGVEGVLVAAKPPRGVRQREMTELLEACGASPTLEVRESAKRHRYGNDWGSAASGRDWSPYGITYDDRLRMRRAARQERITKDSTEVVTNREYRGLSALLEHLPTLPAEDAADRAKLLWQALSAAPNDGFAGTYTWAYYTPYTRQFNSTSVRLLNETAWVPDRSGGLQPPHGVEFESLRWRPDPLLERKIEFRQPEPPSPLVELAEEAGIDPDAVSALKETGLSAEDIREAADRKRREADLRQSAGSSSGGGQTRGGTRTHEGATQDDGEVAAAGATRAAGTPAGGATPRTGGGQPPRRSFIGVERDSEPTEEGSREHERRMSVEEAAIELILQRRPGLRRTPPGNAGYDLYAPGGDGEPVRWIEVKALSGEWESNVTLSHTQFDYAREKGEAYWLYVVEHAGTDGERIVPIQNPAGRDSTYTFDHGWRAAAERTEGDD